MLFTEEEIFQIESLAFDNPLVEKMWKELNKPSTDPAARFYKSLTDAVHALSDELDAVHTGRHNRFRILKSDSKEYKRIFQLLTNSKRIMEGLKESSVVEPEKEVKPKDDKIKVVKEKKEEENTMSFTDRQAELKK